MKRIYLIDVSSLFFRAFYAVRPLTSPSGLPVNAIYGFLSMLLKLMKEEKPEAMVFCYDRKEPSFRKDLFQDYKANRSEMPEDLVPQIPFIKKIAEDLGIPSLEVPGFEADDIIGTLTKISRRADYEVMIVSGDKDFAQLVENHVWLFDTMKNTRMGSAEVKEKWGIRPDQMIDYLALVGDSSDNIPGVSGIGPKGAQKLLEQFESLDGIYKNTEQIKGSTGEKLKADRDSAWLSQKLVTIVTDIKLSEEMQSYHLKPADHEKMRALLAELNFRGFEKSLADLPNWQPREKSSSQNGVPATSAINVVDLDSVKVMASAEAVTKPRLVSAEHQQMTAAELEQKIRAEETVYAFKHELGFVFSKGVNEPVYLVSDDLTEIENILNKQNYIFKGFDLKNYWHFFSLKKPMAAWDGLLAAYVIRAGESTEWRQVYANALGEPPLELPTPSEKLDELLRLEEQQMLAIGKNLKIYQEQDLPLAAVLYRMEKLGIALQIESLNQQSLELTSEIRELEKNIQQLAGEDFNIASPKQLARILFEKMGLTPGKKTKTGFSTDAEVLETLKNEHPIAAHLLEYRELTKLKSTYVDSLPQLIGGDGRLHTTFHQALTTTGRLSSTDPNLQNIPIRTPRGAKVRCAFVAGPGLSLLSADYSQIELRILAHYSEDKNLIRAFCDDLDIHAATASEVFSVPLQNVTSDQRRAAKAINFGIAYGQGAFGLAQNLGVPMGEAKEIINNYFKKFPGVQEYITKIVEQAIENGFVETLSGRRRYLLELKSKNPAIRKFGERAAINAPIQGTAADLMKIAMIHLDAAVKSRMILQVHDELIFEAPQEQLQAEAPLISSIMEQVMKLRVPLKTNWAIGQNWDEAH